MEDNKKNDQTPLPANPGAPGASAAEGGRNDGVVKNFVEVVNETLGTNFKDDETALRTLKERDDYLNQLRGSFGKFSPVLERLKAQHGGEEGAIKFMEDLTKKNDPIAPAPAAAPAAAAQPTVDPSQFVPRDQYERDNFFAANPALKSHEVILEGLKLKFPDKSWAELAGLPEFKPVLDADTVKANRIPLTSSNRVHVENPDQKDAEAFKAAKDGPQAKRAERLATYAIESGRVPIPPGMEEFAGKQG